MMHSSLFRARFFVFASLLGAVFGFAPEAWAALSFCNRTSGAIEAALGYRTDKGDKADVWISEGWWRIEPGQCARVYGQPLTQRFYFYYARPLIKTTKTSSDSAWSGKFNFCTDVKAFRIEGDADCVARKYQQTGFEELDLGGNTRDYTLDFKDDSGR